MTPNGNMIRPTSFPNVPMPDNPFQRIGFGILLVFLFILFSRTFDVIGSSYQIPAIVTALALAATIFSGGLARVVNHSIGKYILGFTAWMAIAIPTSYWRSGSIAVLESWLKALAVYICIVGLIATYDQTLKAIYVTGFSILLLAILALLLGNTASGRLFLTEGKFQNPNDLAQVLLMGLPFLWLMFKSSAQNLFFKLPPLIFSGLVFYVMLKTGSRGAFFGFTTLFVFMFFKASMTDRLAMIILSLFLVGFALVVVPHGLRSRYVTLFSSDEEATGADQELADIAVSSSEARSRVLKFSLLMTLRHPVLGVGPGMFAEAMADDARIEGKRTEWLETHNAYTQVSSEMGIPGVLLYLAVLIGSYRSTNAVVQMSKLRRTERWNAIGNTASCMRMSLLAYAVTALFSSVAYQSLLPTLAGLCTVLYMSARREMEQEAAVLPAVELFPNAMRPVTAAPRLQNVGWQRS
jgi:O-antigen ligase